MYMKHVFFKQILEYKCQNSHNQNKTLIEYTMDSPGMKFRQALAEESPLQILGVANAYIALMAKQVGFKALYLSGAGVANSIYGLPDLALTTLDNVVDEVDRLTDAVDLPLLVDIDTGWGHSLMIERTIKRMIKMGAAAVHIEDQIPEKRCGHRSGKSLVSKKIMADRIKAALNAKTDPYFVVMARTDAIAVEGLVPALDRCVAYVEAGAEMLFVEAATTLEEYRMFKEVCPVPILANLTEFGKTPSFDLSELAQVGIDMALYPLSVNRAMNAAALNVMRDIKKNGSQKQSIPLMQTRQELYKFLNYEQAEQAINPLST
ncbi:Methylisocitrate lyase [Parachlamydia acanthamoebae]|nr:Methylisocitrate lyase [Parachlamydia acanthamoebae]